MAVGRGPLRNRGHAALPETEQVQAVPPAGPSLLDVRVRKVTVSRGQAGQPKSEAAVVLKASWPQPSPLLPTSGKARNSRQRVAQPLASACGPRRQSWVGRQMDGEHGVAGVVPHLCLPPRPLS